MPKDYYGKTNYVKRLYDRFLFVILNFPKAYYAKPNYVEMVMEMALLVGTKRFTYAKSENPVLSPR